MGEKSGTATMARSPSSEVSFRTIGELAERCGVYCWLENRLFELTGSRACGPVAEPGPADPEIRVLLREASAQHALLAAQWWDRLPVRAGVDSEALVVPPSGRTDEALESLGGEPHLARLLSALAEVVLPGLVSLYDDHLAHGSPVSEAPVRAVLEIASFRSREAIRRGRDLLGRHPLEPEAAVVAAEMHARLRALLEHDLGVPPARAS